MLNLDTSDHKRAHREMNGREVMVHPRIWRETQDATRINEILNDPAVFSLVSLPDQGPLDVTAMLADPRCVFLLSEGGTFIAVPDIVELGLYEIHINFLEGYRGKSALAVVQECLRWMFTRTDAVQLWTRIPVFNRSAEAMCWAIHGQLWFVRPGGWPMKDAAPVDVKFYRLSVDHWMWRCKPLIEEGEKFHIRLDEEYARLEFNRPHPHEDDQWHDLAVGAAAEMIYGGQPDKGVAIYNRWARAAGYGSMRLISRNPLVVDIGEALLHATGNTFKVVKCQSAPA